MSIKIENQVLEIEGPNGKAKISLIGGQIISWTPKDYNEDFLYLSPKAIFKVGTAIRGGAPICWPWFADAGTPKHGFARDRVWNVEKQEILENGNAHVILSLVCDDYDGIKAEIDTIVGDNLTQTLKTVNGKKPLEFSVAIHNYWRVGDVTKVSVKGLENIKFTEKAKNVKEHNENPLQIYGPIDRVYHQTEGAIILEDPKLGRKLTLERQGSKSCIVWNCWEEDAKKMSDLPDDGYLEYLCIECGNVLSETIHLEPNQEHTLSYTARPSKM